MVNAFSFSYTPKPSTALASITPLKLLGEGREALRFAANTPMSFIKQNPEVVTEGFWKGRQALTEGAVKGVTSALSGVSGALAAQAAETKAETKLAEDRAHEIAVAKIKAAPTEAEKAYQQQRSDLLAQQIQAATAKNQADVADDGFNAIPSGGRDWSSYNRPNFNQTEDAMTDSAGNVIKPAAPAAAPAPAPAPAAAPAAAPANVTSADPDTVFKTASTATPESTKNVLQSVLDEQIKANKNLETAVNNSRKKLYESASPSVAYEVKVLTETNNFPELEKLAKNKFIDQNVLDEYKNIKSKQELITSRPQTTIPATPAANKSDVLQNLSFNDINITPSEQTQSIRGEYKLPVIESSVPRNLQKSEGDLALTGKTLPLMRVEGAEDKPLAGTPPVEPALPTQQPSEPVLAQAVPETEAEYRYRLESDLTGQPFMNPADARMAKNILEQQLGVKAKVNGIDAGKGKRIYRVEIIEDAPPKTAPEGYFVESIRDADGKETYVYKPKMPVEQQVQSVNVALDRAKTLKTAISEIRGIIGGISPGVGGAANLMAKLPFPTDASTVESLNETIKGIIGFQELVDLKAAGGSLGALSDAELKMLTSLQGSLDVKNLHKDKYLAVLKNIESRASDVEKKMEAHKKDLMNVEKKTNFQPIQPKSQTYQKGQVAIVNGNSYKWDGNQWNLIQ
jgi:hypothetical protein